MILYIPIITILNSRKLKWVEIRKRLFKFFSLFILFGSLNYIFDYVFRHSNIDLSGAISKSVGLAFGISFFEVIFLKKERELD